ncbi:alpha-amylase [Thiohalocapsa halophila]
MQFLADLLSALLNATIIAVAVVILVMAAQEAEQGRSPGDVQGPLTPAVVVAAGETPKRVIVHLLEWRWDDVAAECEAVLGPAGFAAVQVSPPNEHRVVAGGPWWQRYEPVSYALQSRSGGAEAFADMVRRCAAAGVAIYADAVVNHMTGPPLADDPSWGVGSAGSRYDYYDYPGLLPRDFHTPRCALDDRYDDRFALQQCNVGARADLNTDADRLQNRIGDYLNGLLDLGVAGLRIDAARHMAPADIAGILARVRGLPFVYQAFAAAPGAVRAREYLGNGAVTELDYGRRLAAAFRGGSIAELRSLRPGGGADDLVPSRRAVVFVDSHETRLESAAGEHAGFLGPADGARYHLARVFMLAWPYGTPRLLSGFAAADPDAGPPSGDAGTTLPVHGPDGLGCSGAWLCEHRHPAVLGMVGFGNAAAGADVAHWWDDGGGRIAFGRGERGFVVINNTDAAMRQRLRTGLAAGRYCNVIAGRLLDGACVGLTAQADAAAGATVEGAQADTQAMLEVTVGQDEHATFAVPPRSAVAIHVGMVPTAGP